MAGTLKSVRFKLAWQGYRVGDVITPPGALRDWLVANGYVELVEEQSAAPKGRGKGKSAPQGALV